MNTKTSTTRTKNISSLKKTSVSTSKTKISSSTSLSRNSLSAKKSSKNQPETLPSTQASIENDSKDGLDVVLEENQQVVTEVNHDVEEMLKALDPNAAAKAQAAKDINFIFDPRCYDGDIHYSKDGVASYYTQENEKKRAELKTNMMIEEAINAVLDLYPFERDGSLEKAGYIKVNTCIARILRQDLSDAFILKLIEEDWKNDSKGKGYLERKDVYDSLFELGDAWTPEINVFQYAAFFEKLGKVLKGEEEIPRVAKNKVCLNAN